MRGNTALDATGVKPSAKGRLLTAFSYPAACDVISISRT